MSQAIEESCRHLDITEHRQPFAESKVRRNDDRDALVESAYQVEQELTSSMVDNLARVQLLILDYWGTHALSDQQRLDLLEIFQSATAINPI